MPSGTEVLAGVAVVPLIIGLVQVAKSSKMNPDYAPALSLLLGLLASVGYAFAAGTATGVQWMQAVLTGLAYGLAASGLYSGVGVQAATKLGLVRSVEPDDDDDDYYDDYDDDDDYDDGPSLDTDGGIRGSFPLSNDITLPPSPPHLYHTN